MRFIVAHNSHFYKYNTSQDHSAGGKLHNKNIWAMNMVITMNNQWMIDQQIQTLTTSTGTSEETDLYDCILVWFIFIFESSVLGFNHLTVTHLIAAPKSICDRDFWLSPQSFQELNQGGPPPSLWRYFLVEYSQTKFSNLYNFHLKLSSSAFRKPRIYREL